MYCMEYFSHVWGGSTHITLLDRMELKAFRFIIFSPLTVFSLSLFAGMLYLLLSSITISMMSSLLILITGCFPSSCGLAAQDFLLALTPLLSNFLKQELTSTLSHPFLSLVNSGTPCLPLYFQLITTYMREVSRHLSLTFG